MISILNDVCKAGSVDMAGAFSRAVSNTTLSAPMPHVGASITKGNDLAT